MLNQFKLIGSIVGVFTLVLLQYFIITGSYEAGYTACKSQNQEKILEVQNKLKVKERDFNLKILTLSNELTEARLKHENTVNMLKRDYANELRKSEQRAKLYKRYSESDASKQRALARHTAELDRSLTEGRELVKQLTETLRVRDAQLRSLGIYIEENYKLYEQVN